MGDAMPIAVPFTGGPDGEITAAQDWKAG